MWSLRGPEDESQVLGGTPPPLPPKRPGCAPEVAVRQALGSICGLFPKTSRWQRPARRLPKAAPHGLCPGPGHSGQGSPPPPPGGKPGIRSSRPSQMPGAAGGRGRGEEAPSKPPTAAPQPHAREQAAVRGSNVAGKPLNGNHPKGPLVRLARARRRATHASPEASSSWGSGAGLDLLEPATCHTLDLLEPATWSHAGPAGTSHLVTRW